MIGGQALIEGIMMLGPEKKAVVVQPFVRYPSRRERRERKKKLRITGELY